MSSPAQGSTSSKNMDYWIQQFLNCSEEAQIPSLTKLEDLPNLYKDNDSLKQIETIINTTNEHEIEAKKQALVKIKDIAYELFKNSYDNLCDHQRILALAFYYPEIELQDIGTIILRAFETAQNKNCSDESQATSNSSNSEPSSLRDAKRKIEEPSKNSHFVNISHGGGEKYLNEFISGLNQGYAREANGKGIFVTPHFNRETTSDRDWPYACRTPISHFDNPAVLTGQIEKKYLKTANHNSHYERVIMPKHFDKIKNIQIVVKNLFELQEAEIKHILKNYEHLPPAQVIMTEDGIKPDFTNFFSEFDGLYNEDTIERLKACLNYIVS